MKFLLSGGARFYRALTFFSFVGFFFLALTASAQTTNGLSEAEVKGQQLAQELLQATPATNFTVTGVLQIQNAGHHRVEIPIECNTAIGLTNLSVLAGEVPLRLQQAIAKTVWETTYRAKTNPTNNNNEYGSFILILHSDEEPNLYLTPVGITQLIGGSVTNLSALTGAQIMAPFAGSDFWIVDLGLEFFHWPEQKIIKHQERRTRECTVLESANPDPSPSGYSHVDSWIDDETLGIVHAEAYDAKGKLLKVFDPKSFKKVNGQWELQDMEIRNVQTGSRTWIKFDLNNKE